MLQRAATHHRSPLTGTWRREVIAIGVVPATQPRFPCTVLRLAESVVEEADRLADMDEDEKAGGPLGFKHTMHRDNHLRRTMEVVVPAYARPMTTQILRKCGNCSEVYERGIVKSDIAAHWRPSTRSSQLGRSSDRESHGNARRRSHIAHEVGILGLQPPRR